MEDRQKRVNIRIIRIPEENHINRENKYLKIQRLPLTQQSSYPETLSKLKTHKNGNKFETSF